MKKNFFAIAALVISLAFSFCACDTKSDNNVGDIGDGGDNETESTETIGGSSSDNNNEADTSDDNETDVFITDWESDGIFSKTVSEYEFDFTANDTDFSYEIGSEENEELFARILSGDESYKDYFTWFMQTPEYIYRFNEERYKAAGEIIREGAFTQELQDKYFGLFTADSTSPSFSALGIVNESYLIYFNEDWSIDCIGKIVQCGIQCNPYERWHYSLIGYTLGGYQPTVLESELVQYDEVIDPIYEEQSLIGYKVTFASLSFKVDMGDGKTADCAVDVTYKSEMVTEPVWNGQKQKHEEASYISMCHVTADINNCYSGGFEMFDRILIFTKLNGCWDLLRVWECFREEALTTSLNLYETNEQKIYHLA